MDHFTKEREIQQRVERLVADEVEQVEVLELELDAPRQTLRVFIDADGGVTHELCVRATNAIRDEFESFSIEVSSPGIERPLRHRHHFEQVKGSQIRLRRRGSHRPVVGLLADVADDAVLLRREDGSELSVPLTEIVRSNLVAKL